MTVFQEQSIILAVILLVLIAIFFEIFFVLRAAKRHERQSHADAKLIVQYLDAIRKQLAALGTEE